MNHAADARVVNFNIIQALCALRVTRSICALEDQAAVHKGVGGVKRRIIHLNGQPPLRRSIDRDGQLLFWMLVAPLDSRFRQLRGGSDDRIFQGFDLIRWRFIVRF